MELRGGAGFDQQAVGFVLDHIGDAADGGCDYGDAALEGFGDDARVAFAFPVAGEEQEVVIGDDTRDILRRQGAAVGGAGMAVKQRKVGVGHTGAKDAELAFGGEITGCGEHFRQAFFHSELADEKQMAHWAAVGPFSSYGRGQVSGIGELPEVAASAEVLKLTGDFHAYQVGLQVSAVHQPTARRPVLLIDSGEVFSEEPDDEGAAQQPA